MPLPESGDAGIDRLLGTDELKDVLDLAQNGSGADEVGIDGQGGEGTAYEWM